MNQVSCTYNINHIIGSYKKCSIHSQYQSGIMVHINSVVYIQYQSGIMVHIKSVVYIQYQSGIMFI